MKTTSNLSVDMAKFKVYDAWKSGIINEDDENKFLGFIKKAEILTKDQHWNYDKLLEAYCDLFIGGNSRGAECRILFANEYINDTTINNAYRLADITGVDYNWYSIFSVYPDGCPYAGILANKTFCPKEKADFAQYLEKDGEQYAQLRDMLIKGSDEQE